ncbi:MAG: hypothetical protein R3C11_28700 [Planctomycetaceae bacterium]
MPDQMGGEALQLEKLNTGGALKVSSREMHFENATFDSAIGHFRLVGDVNLEEMRAQNNWQIQLATLLNSDLAIQGYVDLAEISRIFPQALAIKEGMQIVAGQADLSLHTRSEWTPSPAGTVGNYRSTGGTEWKINRLERAFKSRLSGSS